MLLADPCHIAQASGGTGDARRRFPRRRRHRFHDRRRLRQTGLSAFAPGADPEPVDTPSFLGRRAGGWRLGFRRLPRRLALESLADTAARFASVRRGLSPTRRLDRQRPRASPARPDRRSTAARAVQLAKRLVPVNLCGGCARSRTADRDRSPASSPTSRRQSVPVAGEQDLSRAWPRHVVAASGTDAPTRPPDFASLRFALNEASS